MTTNVDGDEACKHNFTGLPEDCVRCARERYQAAIEAARQDGYRTGVEAAAKAVSVLMTKDVGDERHINRVSVLTCIRALSPGSEVKGEWRQVVAEREDGCYWGHGCLQCSTCQAATERVGELRALADVKAACKTVLEDEIVSDVIARLRSRLGKGEE